MSHKQTHISHPALRLTVKAPLLWQHPLEESNHFHIFKLHMLTFSLKGRKPPVPQEVGILRVHLHPRLVQLVSLDKLLVHHNENIKQHPPISPAGY